MSTAIQESSFLRGSANYSDQPTQRFVLHTTTENFGEAVETSIRYSPNFRDASHSQQKQKQKSRVLRRLNGFLTEIDGKSARVTFVENGEPFQYDMPVERLSKCGIDILNQPFEMDEVEIQTDDGLVVGYRFRPLAKASDAYRETLNFDKERKRKRDLILKKFAKGKA
jgi:hypothetical protein